MQPSSTDYVALPPILRSATWPAKLPRRYKILAACIAVFLVQYSQSQAMIAPFIVRSTPGELLGPDAVGFIFAVYPLATALATPLPPRVLGCIGLRGMVVLGLSLSCIGNVLFGAAGHYAAEEWASVLGPLLTVARALGGVGADLSEAGCLTAVSSAGWGADLGKALSSIEVTTGIGAAMGAAAGGYLYTVSGFFLPMAVGAAVLLLVLPIAICYLPRSAGEGGGGADGGAGGDDAKLPAELQSAEPQPPTRYKSGPFHGVGRRLGRIATCASLALGAAVFEGLNPLLEPHLKRHPFHLDVEPVGLLLALICLIYTLTALPVGWLTDRANKGSQAGCRLRVLMLSGWVCTLIAGVLLAPGGGGGGDGGPDYSMWPLPGSLAHLCLAISIPLLGAGAALVIIPSLPDMQRGIAEDDDENSESGMMRAAICAIWNGAYAGGSAVGPLLATMLYAREGWASIVLAQIALSLAAGAVLLTMACLPEQNAE